MLKKQVLSLLVCGLSFSLWAQYSGHGSSSVSAAHLQKYAPKPIESSLRERIQRRLDLHASSLGRIDDSGKNLYFNWNVTGVSQIWKLESPKSFPIQLTSGEDATRLLDISPDNSFIVVSRDRQGDEYPRLYVQNSSGGDLELVHGKDKVQSIYSFMSSDARYLYFRANDKKPSDYTLYRYDRSNKKIEEVYSGEGFWTFADIHENGDLLIAKYPASTAAEFYLLKKGSQTPEDLFGQNEQVRYSAQFADTKTSDLIVSTDKWDDFTRLYTFSQGKFEPFMEPVSKEIEGFSVSARDRRLVVEFNDQGYSRVEAFNIKNKKRIKMPEFEDALQVWMGARSHNGRYISLGVEKTKSPRAINTLDWSRNRVTTWTLPSTPEIDTRKFSERKLEFYPAADGTPIPMFVNRPAQCLNKNCPVIVSFHGGPEGQSVPYFDPIGDLYLEAGFVLVEPNVRGSAGYGKKWLDADNGVKRLEVIGDIRDCARYIKKNWAVEGVAPKVGVMGGSYGGYATLMAMTYFAGEYDVGVSIVGISNLVTFLQNTAPYRRALRESEYGYLDRDMKALVELSPTTHIAKAKGPLLIIQGATDPRVPVGESIQIYEAWKKRGLPVDLVIFEDEGHGVRKRANRVLSTGHTLAFFMQHLKP